MQFQQHNTPHLPTIESYHSGSITIDGKTYNHPILLHQQVEPLPENWQPEQLNFSDFQAAINHQAQIIIIGTGEKQQFLHPKLVAQLTQAGVGIESMSTDSACRTIILLQSEGRRVWAWLKP